MNIRKLILTLALALGAAISALAQMYGAVENFYEANPDLIGGVWYDAATDTYNWIGPKFGRRMSESRAQFLSEVCPYL